MRRGYAPDESHRTILFGWIIQKAESFGEVTRDAADPADAALVSSPVAAVRRTNFKPIHRLARATVIL